MNPKTHLNNDQIVGYIYQMLSDAEREVFDKHLVNCPTCRARLSSSEHRQLDIENALKAEINGSSPSPEMVFGQITPRLKRQNRHWQRFTIGIPLVAASFGLIFALIGVWNYWVDSNQLMADLGKPLLTPFSVLGGFFFMFVSMNQYDRSFNIRPRFIFTVILSLLLWLGSSILGLLNIIVIRDLTIATVLFGGGNAEGASVVAIITTILAAMVVIGVIIGGAEYHYKHIGQPSSWKMFVWTISIQLLIMILPYFII